jgi:hypothetical protein
VKLPLISAGEFFELLRPAAYVLSALLSIWVLASARRRGFRLFVALVWALGTFLLPFVILPVYLIVLIFRFLAQRSRPATDENELEPNTESQAPSIKYRFLLPTVYGIVLLGATGLYLYRDYNTVDAHLARATQAKLSSQPAKTIREYRAALSLEDSAHTHKLLGVELAEAGQGAEALKEFRLAEQGGEPDELLPFRVAQSMEATQQTVTAVLEYGTFLDSHACTQAVADRRCLIAQQRVVELKKNLKE